MRTRIVVGTAILALAVTACSSGGGERLGTGEDYTVLGALAELPGRPSPGLMIQTADLTGATEVAGLERPDTAEMPAMHEWLSPLLGNTGRANPEPGPVFVPIAELFNIQQLNNHAEFEEALGWSLVDVDSFTEMTLLPRQQLTVISGDFDDDAVLAGLPEVADGVVTYGEGEDFSHNSEETSVVSRLGRPLRLAHQDGRVAASPSTNTVQLWFAGAEETLADDEPLAAVATALDEQDVLSAVLLSGGNFQGAQMLGQMVRSEHLLEELEDQLTDLPSVGFGTVGIGWAVQDEQPVVVAAYHLGTESAAEEAVPQFEAMYRDGRIVMRDQPLGDYIETLSVETSGAVLVVRTRSTDQARPTFLVDMLYSRDVPFAHQ